MARLIRIAPWAHQASQPEFSDIGAMPAQPIPEFDEPAAVKIKMPNNYDALTSRKIEAHARADERRRLSRLLHDEVGQSLTALTVKLAVLRGRASGAILTQLVDAQKLLEKTLDQIQGLSKNLHPSAVEDLGLVAALRSHIHNFSQHTAIAVQFKTDRRVGGDTPVQPELAVAIFRSVEALLRDLRAAAPSKTILTLALARNALQLQARALLNGSATVSVASPGVSPGEVVLTNFHEQVLMAGGSVECRASRKHALITARFPMTNHAKV